MIEQWCSQRPLEIFPSSSKHRYFSRIRYNACRKLKDRIAETGKKNGKYYVENIPLKENVVFSLFYNTELDMTSVTLAVINGAERFLL